MTNNSRINNSSNSFDAMAKEVLEDLNDPQENRFSSSYIKTLFDEGQKEYCESSGALRSRIGITSKENQRIYNFPDDMVRPIRLEDKRGKEIVPVTGSYVESLFGNNFRNRENNKDLCPSYYYSDYVGDGQFELYPNPSPTIDRPFIEPNNGFMRKVIANLDSLPAVVGLPPEIASVIFSGSELHVLTKTLVGNNNQINTYKIFGETLILVESISFSTVNPLIQFLSVKDKTSVLGAKKFYVAADVELFEIEDGVVSVKGTLPSPILKLFPINQANIQESFIVQLDNFDIYRVNAIGALTFLHNPGQAAIDYDAGISDECGNVFSIYVSYSSGGIFRYDISTFSITPVQISTETAGGLAVLNNIENSNSDIDGFEFVYFYNPTNSTVKRYSIKSGNTTSIDYQSQTEKVFSISSVGRFFGDGVNTFYTMNSSIPCLEFTKFVGDSFSGSFYSTSLEGDFVSESVGVNGELYHGMQFENIIYKSTKHHGDISFIDGFIFDSETGGLLDISDDEDTINSNGSEVGGVNVISSDEEIAYLIYVRLPISGLLEISSPLALKEYAKYRARLRDGDAKSISLAQTHLSLYNDQLKREMGKMGKGYNQENTGTLGQYF